MKFEQEAYILYWYIVGGVATTKMSDMTLKNYNFPITAGEVSQIFAEYNINYPDRGEGNRRGYVRGFHLGKYKNGFVDSAGGRHQITVNEIANYMKAYRNGRCNTLEEYLKGIFPPQRVQAPAPKPAPRPPYTPPPAPKPTYTPPAAPKPTYTPPPRRSCEAPSQPRYTQRSTTSYTPRYSGRSYGEPDWEKIIGFIVGVLIIGAVIFFGGKLLKGCSSGSAAEVSTGSEVIPGEGLPMELEIDVNFNANAFQMMFKEPYEFYYDGECIGELTVGKTSLFKGTSWIGRHKMWVQSGDSKSEEIEIILTNDNKFFDMECSVGLFGPKFYYHT